MPFLFEHLPNGFEGPSNLLRSIPHPPMKAFVRFLNTTETPVDVMWVNFKGTLERYRTLGTYEYFNCDTFVDHIWVFRDAKTNDHMCVDHKEIFRPKPYHVTVNAERKTIRIHRPVLSLLTLAAQSVRNRMENLVEPFFLEIPFHLQCLIANLKLERWKPVAVFNVSEGTEDTLYRKDFDEFKCNIMFIRFKLFNHAKKLMGASKKLSSHGASAHTVRQMLKNVINFLDFDLTDGTPGQYTRKLAPTIWKQMIFLRINFDNLNAAIERPCSMIDDPSSAYNSLVNLSKRRLRLLPQEQKDSVQRYHWEQLNLLGGKALVKQLKKSDPEAYDIPELIPLSQRLHWKWVTVRREQFLLDQDREMQCIFRGLTSTMIQMTDRLENVFQVLCFCHYYLLGRHITEEETADKVESKKVVNV